MCLATTPPRHTRQQVVGSSSPAPAPAHMAHLQWRAGRQAAGRRPRTMRPIFPSPPHLRIAAALPRPCTARASQARSDSASAGRVSAARRRRAGQGPGRPPARRVRGHISLPVPRRHLGGSRSGLQTEGSGPACAGMPIPPILYRRHLRWRMAAGSGGLTTRPAAARSCLKRLNSAGAPADANCPIRTTTGRLATR